MSRTRHARTTEESTPPAVPTLDATEVDTTAVTTVTEDPVPPATVEIPTNEARIYNLNAELLRIERQKKDAGAGFRDEIKRIKNEIKEIFKSAGENLGA